MMVEIAVDLTSIQHFAQNVYVLKEEVGAVVEPQHLRERQLLEAVISLSGMVFVMITTIILSAPMMVEIAVDLTSIQHFAQNVYVLKEEVGAVVEPQHLWELQLAQVVMSLLEIVFVMISTTI